ncbi:hypothetical protein QUF76_08915, partial [Desulfobacterales bacterium HSG16]|nr:hypothetical protein [Desulfobacterales bacterium HSG16]
MMACEDSDSKYPDLQLIYFYLTKECNLRCRHCWIAPKYQSSDCASNFLDLQLFKDIIKNAQQLGLTG